MKYIWTIKPEWNYESCLEFVPICVTWALSDEYVIQ